FGVCCGRPLVTVVYGNGFTNPSAPPIILHLNQEPCCGWQIGHCLHEHQPVFRIPGVTVMTITRTVPIGVVAEYFRSLRKEGVVGDRSSSSLNGLVCDSLPLRGGCVVD